MKRLLPLLLLLFLTVCLFAQAQDDWSDATINYPTSYDDTLSMWYPSPGDTITYGRLTEMFRAIRVLQEVVGLKQLHWGSIDYSLINTTDTLMIGYVNEPFTVDTFLVYVTKDVPNFAFNILHGRDNAPANNNTLFSSGQTVNSKGFTRYSTFNDNTIDGGSVIHIVFTSVTTRPQNFGITLIGRNNE